MKQKTTFQDLGILPEITEVLRAQKIVTPTKVQQEAIPAIIKGENLLVQSPTGTGKTLAYLTPILSQLDIESKALQVLVLVPSRELAVQVAKLARTFSEELRVATLIGGANLNRQLEALKAKPQIAVGTPGRVFELLQKRKINGQLIKTIIVDEADKMFSIGFMDDVRGILKATLKSRQVLFFSATLPGQLQEQATQLIDNPRFLKVGEEGRVPKTISHVFFMSSKEQKNITLTRLLRRYQPVRAIVFVQRNEGVSSLARRLQDSGIDAVGLHSALPQQARKKVLEDYRQGKVRVLITTDLLARGMDFAKVDYIFNYDLPLDEKHYLHRAGRTGRAGEEGTAVTLVTEEQKGIIPKLARTLGIKFTQMGISEKGIFPVSINERKKK
ncbi:MAG: DEAD/DEAH box helicase [Peptococcia bacterium]